MTSMMVNSDTYNSFSSLFFSTKQKRDSDLAGCNVLSGKIHSCLVIFFYRCILILHYSVCRSCKIHKIYILLFQPFMNFLMIYSQIKNGSKEGFSFTSLL